MVGADRRPERAARAPASDPPPQVLPPWIFFFNPSGGAPLAPPGWAQARGDLADPAGLEVASVRSTDAGRSGEASMTFTMFKRLEEEGGSDDETSCCCWGCGGPVMTGAGRRGRSSRPAAEILVGDEIPAIPLAMRSRYWALLRALGLTGAAVAAAAAEGAWDGSSVIPSAVLRPSRLWAL